MLLEYIAHQAADLETLVRTTTGTLAAIAGKAKRVKDKILNHTVIYDGPGGAGKTVLAYYINSLWRNKNPALFKPSGASLTSDKYDCPWGSTLITMPGQSTQSRIVSHKKAQKGAWYQFSPTLDGIVFVCSWGYPRAPILGENVSFEDSRQAMLKREIEAFEELKGRVLAMDKHPRFFLFTLSKVDLYQDELAEAVRYYDTGPFARIKDEIAGALGHHAITFEKSYVSTRLDSLTWRNALVKQSTMSETERDSLLAAHCAHVLKLSQMAQQ